MQPKTVASPHTNGYHPEPPAWMAELDAPEWEKAPAPNKPAAQAAPVALMPKLSKAEIDEKLLKEGAHDEGNAQCTHAKYDEKFLHSKAMGWLYHTGTHWSMDEADAKVERAITDTLITRLNMAAKAELAEERVKKFIPNNGRVQGAKAQLRSLVSVTPDEFDTDPDVLNCKNGVVDLRTGKITPHSSSQRYMHCTAVPFRPGADSSVWVDWLTEAVGADMADWLQLAVGYSLTGHTREEIMFYLFGPPRSGKGTFTETILRMLGMPLAKEVTFSMFTAQRTGDSQNFDLAPLKPGRFVAASESNAYERFNEAKVKALTGGNEVYCAFKHRDHFNYQPQFKIWLSSNQPVNADPDDDAVWGRIRLVEFPTSHQGKEDKTKKHNMRLKATLEGVLAWAIAGAQRWYELDNNGLPEVTQSATAKAEHRSELDNVQAWLDEKCVIAETFCAYRELYKNYEDWCKDRGIEAKKQKGFSQSLKNKGFKPVTKRDGTTVQKGYTGLYLR
jgi:putative DNA primase/helicase